MHCSATQMDPSGQFSSLRQPTQACESVLHLRLLSGDGQSTSPVQPAAHWPVFGLQYWPMPQSVAGSAEGKHATHLPVAESQIGPFGSMLQLPLFWQPVGVVLVVLEDVVTPPTPPVPPVSVEDVVVAPLPPVLPPFPPFAEALVEGSAHERADAAAQAVIAARNDARKFIESTSSRNAGTYRQKALLEGWPQRSLVGREFCGSEIPAEAIEQNKRINVVIAGVENVELDIERFDDWHAIRLGSRRRHGVTVEWGIGIVDVGFEEHGNIVQQPARAATVRDGHVPTAHAVPDEFQRAPRARACGCSCRRETYLKEGVVHADGVAHAVECNVLVWRDQGVRVPVQESQEEVVELVADELWVLSRKEVEAVGEGLCV